MTITKKELEGKYPVKITGRTEEGHTKTTFKGKYNGKEAIIKYSTEEDVKREKEALKLTENTSICTPKILDYEETKKASLLIIEKIDSKFPTKEKWQDLDFCKKLTSSAAEILNQIHSEKLNQKAQKTKYCSQNQSRAINAMTRKNPKIEKELNNETFEICRQIIQKVNSSKRFTHGDFSTENILISSEGIETVIDWADCGTTSWKRDIALFEASFIDEYIRFFHPKKYQDIRKTFRKQLNNKIDSELDLYRFHQNSVILTYLKRGRCSKEWLNVGSKEEIEKHREKVVQQDQKTVKNILKTL